MGTLAEGAPELLRGGRHGGGARRRPLLHVAARVYETQMIDLRWIEPGLGLGGSIVKNKTDVFSSKCATHLARVARKYFDMSMKHGISNFGII